MKSSNFSWASFLTTHKKGLVTMESVSVGTFARHSVVFLFIVLTNTPAFAQGFATWLGDRVGLGNVGRALDNANREAKKAVPIYGQAEEAVTGAGRHLVTGATVESTAPILKNLILASRQDALNAGARPLPPEVIWEFNGFYGPDVLGAYWRVGQGHELSLQANAFRFGDRAAIALDTVLVFRSHSEANSVWLWAHELAHIEQYRRWRIDNFVKRYIRNHEAVEAEANRRADEFMNWRARRMEQVSSPVAIPQMPPVPVQQNGAICMTSINSCQWFGPIGWDCMCASPMGLQPGVIR
jgi:hypothetical protein